MTVKTVKQCFELKNIDFSTNVEKKLDLPLKTAKKSEIFSQLQSFIKYSVWGLDNCLACGKYSILSQRYISKH